jgi:hypothetical protein
MLVRNTIFFQFISFEGYTEQEKNGKSLN